MTEKISLKDAGRIALLQLHKAEQRRLDATAAEAKSYCAPGYEPPPKRDWEQDAYMLKAILDQRKRPVRYKAIRPLAARLGQVLIRAGTWLLIKADTPEYIKRVFMENFGMTTTPPDMEVAMGHALDLPSVRPAGHISLPLDKAKLTNSPEQADYE